MKTQNYTQTKVNSRVTIVVLYISTVALSVALVGLTANAQELWNQFSKASSYGKMASVMMGYPSETANTDAAFEAIDAEILTQLVNFYAVEAEESLKIEDWMMNSNHFSRQEIAESVEMEKPLEIEPWMTREDLFNSSEPLTSADPTLEVESWMTDGTLFHEEFTLTTGATDEANSVEEWMTMEQNFNNQAALIATGSEPALAVESWMINEEYFKAGESLTANDNTEEISIYFHKRLNLGLIRASK